MWIIVLFTACQSEPLDLAPLTSIPEAEAYNTPEKILAQVNGLYGQLGSPLYFGGQGILFNEQRGDEFSQNDGNNETGANVWNQSITSSGFFVNAVWEAAYQMINSANILLDRLAAQTFLPAELRDAYAAEARFIRAFAYFGLVQTYARPFNQNPDYLALPLRLTPNLSGGNNQLAFSTVREVYDQILLDLDAAEEDLPITYSTALLSVSRAHKATAIALKTRVYLTQSNYNKVIEEAVKLVPTSPPFQYQALNSTHSLEPSIATVFSGSYSGAEAIFSIPFIITTEAPSQQSALAYNYLSPVTYLNTAGIVAHEVFATNSVDARRNLVISNAAGQRLLNKFPNNIAPFMDYVPLIRYAEVLLNYAEAAAQLNQLSRAKILLEAVRHRSDPNFVFGAPAESQAGLVQLIFTEKRIELLGEGFRSWELFRTVQPLPAKIGNAGVAPRILPTDANYVWPIPSGEIAYNPLAR
ncbi:RagB/SusD family nutrient uptake outer membrane protein [Sphingobacterium corticibacter]|nr:RagB/SusD family nutrient uptake outer membrane protein [Sphingobacterium corticibacter]